MKSTKKNFKKSRKNLDKKRTKIDKRKIYKLIAVLGLFFVIAGLTLGIHLIKKNRADKTVRIAFYGLSDDICNILKDNFPKEENVILNFDVISDSAFDLKIIKQKYDMLFTWRGEITDRLSDSCEDIPKPILETIPASLRNKKCIPVLLDHCELSFRSEILKKLNMPAPLSFSAFIDYLNESKNYVFSPFFCNGAENRILIDFVGALVQAKAGLNAYNKLIEELRKAKSLEKVIDVDLGGITLRSILDMLQNWPSEGVVHPAWFNGTKNDLLYFAEDGQLGAFFTFLSEHRKISYNVIKNFEASVVPPDVSSSNYGLIAPSISAMLISDNSNCKRYLAGFFTEETQSELSNKTMLAPVHYRAQAYDRQADDVRFWAASCAGGALPDLYLAVYQRNSAALEKMAAEIRTYIR